MKHFIFCLLLAATGIVLNVQAQTPSDFGFDFVVEEDEESHPIPSTQELTENQTSEAADQNTENSQKIQIDESIQPETATTEASSAEEEPQEEDTEDEQEQLIYMALNDIQSSLAVVRSVSYCSAAFVLFNATKKEIQEISGTIAIGKYRKNFKFSNVSSGSSLGWPIQIVGNACESIMAPPTLQIEKCKVKGMSDKKCRSKLRYVPLGAS